MARKSGAARRRSALRVVHYDGSQWTVFDAVETPEGTITDARGRYEFAADVAVPLAADLYVVAVDEVTLRSEADFHATRRRIVFRSLFSNAGDLMELARNVAVFVAFLLAIVVWLQVSGLGGQIAHIDAAVNALKAVQK